MAYRDYQAPGVNVVITRQNAQPVSNLTEFLPVFVGTGMTARNRIIELSSIRANVLEFPRVQLEWDIEGNYNSQLFKQTDFSLQSLSIHKEIVSGTPISALAKDVDYEVVETVVNNTSNGKARTIINILNTDKVKDTDLLYDFSIRIENTDQDFDLRLIDTDDRYYAKEIFGPLELEEDGSSFFNDVAIAADIAFRIGTERFFYMEVPRDYGNPATAADIKLALDKIYYKNNAYRIVPLTSAVEVSSALAGFTTSISNPVDRREVVGFTGYDSAEIVDMNNIEELIEKVGGFSATLNNQRILNIFGGNSVEYVANNTRYVLPMHFMNVAIAAYDTVVGMAQPLSTREITVFSKLNGPRFRPRQWDQLARHGVFIVFQNEENGPITIRHQLTSKQSEAAEDQEYSIVKNFDAVTKRLRDRLSPYAGSANITDGYLEKIDATLTSAIEEVKQLGWARDLQVISPWKLRAVTSGEGGIEEKRNLVAQFKLEPVYPGNNLDLYLVV